MDQVIGSFRYSPPKIAGLIAGGVLMTIVCLLIALQVIPSGTMELLIAGYFGTPLFAGAIILIIIRLFQSGPVVEVRTSGIRYRRWPKDFFVPWTAVSTMSIRVVPGRKSLILRLGRQEPSGPVASREILMVGLDGSIADLLNAISTARSGSQRRSA